MGKKVLKIVIVCVVVVVSIGCGIQIYRINKESIRVPEKISSHCGEFLAIGENVILDESEKMNGYEVRVNEVKITQNSDGNLPVIYVCITVKNTNKNSNDAIGLDFGNMRVTGTDINLMVDSELYEKQNPSMEGYMMFSLRPQSEMDFVLPYCWYAGGKINMEILKKKELSLVLSCYPEKRIINLWE